MQILEHTHTVQVYWVKQANVWHIYRRKQIKQFKLNPRPFITRGMCWKDTGKSRSVIEKQFQTSSTAQSASTDHSSLSQTHCTAESQRIKQQSLFYLCLFLLLCGYLDSVTSCILINQTAIQLSMHIQFALGYINVSGKIDLNSILTLFANITETITTMIVVAAGVKFAICLKCRTSWRVFFKLDSYLFIKIAQNLYIFILSSSVPTSSEHRQHFKATLLSMQRLFLKEGRKIIQFYCIRYLILDKF